MHHYFIEENMCLVSILPRGGGGGGTHYILGNG